MGFTPARICDSFNRHSHYSFGHKLLLSSGLTLLIGASAAFGASNVLAVEQAGHGPQMARETTPITVNAEDHVQVELESMLQRLADPSVPAIDAADRLISFVMNNPGHPLTKGLDESYTDHKYVTRAARDDFAKAITGAREEVIGENAGQGEVMPYWASRMQKAVPDELKKLSDSRLTTRAVSLSLPIIIGSMLLIRMIWNHAGQQQKNAESPVKKRSGVASSGGSKSGQHVDAGKLARIVRGRGGHKPA